MFTNSIVQRCRVVASLWPFLAAAAPSSSGFHLHAELKLARSRWMNARMGRQVVYVECGTETSQGAARTIFPGMLAIVAHSPMATLYMSMDGDVLHHTKQYFFTAVHEAVCSSLWLVAAGHVFHCFSRIGLRSSSLPYQRQ